MAAKLVAGELGLQFRVIIDLAVEDNDEAPVRRFHRLMAERRQIDDRQPPVDEGHAGLGLDPDSFVVGAAESKALGHPARFRRQRLFRRTRPVDQSGNTAHGC